ncbi:MAG: TRAP transporter fused permease subunit [Thermodesulfobacteriota bacterium]|nr:TRAP transporter fused permease subunit [Thermodesulfobacteriota bacterium]
MKREKTEDREISATARQYGGLWRVLIGVIAVGYVLFHLYTGYAGPFPNLRQRAIHVGFALILTFLILPPYIRKRGGRWESVSLAVDLAAVAMTIWCCVYIIVKYHWIMDHPAESTSFQLILGTVAFLLTLEAGRRTIGLLFPILTLFFLLYAYLGPYIPEIPLIGDALAYWGHRGFNIPYIIQIIFLSDLGLWGFVTGISATIVAMFIIFGAFILFTGGGETFIDLAVWSTGRFFGGAAKVAVVASGFFGMISGSAVANVATTGTFTIPMMKRLKYGNEFAAAVESTASTGGQITPPIMGAGAFIMAEILEISYLQVALCAAIPAYLYYLGCFSAIHFESVKRNLGRVPVADVKPFREIMRPSRSVPLFVPIFILLGFLLQGYTPETSAFWAILAAVILFLFSTFHAAEVKMRWIRLLKGMDDAGRSMIKVVPLLVCANIIISLINITGIGVKLSEFILSVAGQNEFLALILAAAVTLILGMGVPTTAAYLLAAAVIAPSLKMMGFEAIAVHMFIFYFAVLSAITPPVCAAVYVGAGIAQSDWVKTAWIAMRLALVEYMIPFIFIYNTSLLLLGPTETIIFSFITATIGVSMIGCATMGYLSGPLNLFMRLAILGGSTMCITPGLRSDMAGLGILALVYAYQRIQVRKRQGHPALAAKNIT